MAMPAQPAIATATLVCPPLVRNVAFRGANKKYLGWNKGGFLKFCFDDLTSPFVKHELVEQNDNKNGERHVHIKCCFNQKFWTREAPESSLIVARGESVDTDHSSWSCSLFRLVFLDEDAKVNMRGAVRVHSVQKSKPLTLCSQPQSGVSSNLDSCLYAQGDELNGISYAESLVILPQYVAFKGDDGLYLGCSKVGLGSTYWVQFNENNVANPSVANEVTSWSDGIQLRNLTYDENWKLIEEYVGLDPYKGTGEIDHRFEPFQLNDQTVVLRSFGNNLFCSRYNDYLCAWMPTMVPSARLTVEEPVLSRRVHSVKYDKNNVVTSNALPLVLQSLSHTNRTSNPDTHKMIFSQTVKNSRRWSNSVSCTWGVSGSFTLGIAELLGFELQVSAEETRTMEWGGAEEEEITFGGNYTVTTDPGQSVTVSLLVTQATYSVKFSYVQEDLLVTGKRVSTSRDDGHFTAVNYINLVYDASVN